MNSTNSVSLKEFPKVKRECVEEPTQLKLNISSVGRVKLEEIAGREFCNNLSWAIESLIKDKHSSIFDEI